MSIRDYNKKLNLIISDNVTGQYKSIKLEEEYDTKLIESIIEKITEDNITNRIGYKVDFMIVS